jgi:hypothetical protein
VLIRPSARLFDDRMNPVVIRGKVLGALAYSRHAGKMPALRFSDAAAQDQGRPPVDHEAAFE